MTLQSRTILNQELSDLNAHILKLTDMVDAAVEQAMEALTTRNVALAQAVISDDDQINLLRFEIEEECLRILATQQPFATDLRTTITAMHLATELERIGDHASGIARLVERMADEPEIDSLHKLPKMAKRSRRMLRESIDAYLNADSEIAIAMVKRDYKLDQQYHKVVRETLNEMRDDDYIRRATYLLWVGHNLERIGDRATNIAERVIFMTTGQFVENILTMEDDLPGI
ncbi:MAG TPA: phosphate signaling complex protein PhoU [candidate division Zixibacteria bacterium]|nr:phosphate signaling complex protein PhoU [candidate division Zixibacteria bacterium]